MYALSIENLTKTYSNGFVALKGIDLDVEEGDFFALLGANGAGKSTTIGIVSSLINKTSGSVSIFGHDIVKNNKQAKMNLGIVPQEINFNQYETVENILLIYAGYFGIARKEAKIRAKKALKQMHLWEKRDTVSRRLSGGMKRRVMIARALIPKPKLLILDEPTAGVDIEIRRSMWEMMEQVNKEGTAIILTTHYLEEAENLCRNIAIIHEGMIVENSDMATLLSYINVNYFILDLEKTLITPPEIAGYKFDLIEDKVLSVAIPKSNSLNQLFEQLSIHNIQIKSLKNKSNRLEQLFMDIVQ